jgi:hypothetical protein
MLLRVPVVMNSLQKMHFPRKQDFNQNLYNFGTEGLPCFGKEILIRVCSPYNLDQKTFTYDRRCA